MINWKIWFIMIMITATHFCVEFSEGLFVVLRKSRLPQEHLIIMRQWHENLPPIYEKWIIYVDPIILDSLLLSKEEYPEKIHSDFPFVMLEKKNFHSALSFCIISNLLYRKYDIFQLCNSICLWLESWYLVGLHHNYISF